MAASQGKSLTAGGINMKAGCSATVTNTFNAWGAASTTTHNSATGAYQSVYYIRAQETLLVYTVACGWTNGGPFSYFKNDVHNNTSTAYAKCTHHPYADPIIHADSYGYHRFRKTSSSLFYALDTYCYQYF